MLVLDGQLLLADSADVWDVLGVVGRVSARGVVVALVQAQVLRVLVWVRAIHHYGLNSRLEQLGVVAVGPVDDHAQRAALLVHHDAAFRALFPAVGGVFAHFVAAVAGLAHAAVGALPVPVYLLELLTL